MSGPSPEEQFAEVAATTRRCCWLDGTGSPGLLAWLDPDDVSLTYDAARREVVRHTESSREVVGDDVLAVLADELTAGGPDDRWIGYLGYAARPDLPAAADPHQPDAVWLRPSHVRRLAVRSGALPRPPAAEPAPGVPAGYAAAFARVQEHLHAGDSYEVNLTYRTEVASDTDPVTAYRRLRAASPAPYAGFVQHDLPGARAWLLSSSPERFARLAADGTVETRPIKGTAPRDPDPATDADLAHRLATEPRYRAENLMIVDLLRHDLARVCEVGSVEVPTLMAVESYAPVHQLVSTVRGRLTGEPGPHRALAAVRSLFPAGSMTGAPKLRTMRIIEELETTPRGVYAGAFGWLAGDGSGDLGVVIRSLTTAGDGRWRAGTGGGVTVHSELAGEWAEAVLKTRALLRVLDPAAGPASGPASGPAAGQTP